MIEKKVNTEIILRKIILRDSELIGYINLIKYKLGNFITPHLEYEIVDEKYRNKGIMSEELSKFLEYCKEEGFLKIIASVKKNNIPSVKILEKNNFIKLKELEEVFVYVSDLRCNAEFLKNCLKICLKNPKFLEVYNFDRK